jgi:peptidoglycan-associated lipoprotein
VTPPPVNQDSIDAARARQDSIIQAQNEARERAAAEQRERAQREAARADSIAAVAAAAAAENEAVRMAFASTIHFDFDRSEIKAEWVTALDAKVAVMMANPSMSISVVGHADERGSDEYNIALGNRRALAVKRYMVDRGIAENRIQTSSLGEARPMVDAHNEAAWAQNRRAEFSIVGMANLRRPGS